MLVEVRPENRVLVDNKSHPNTIASIKGNEIILGMFISSEFISDYINNRYTGITNGFTVRKSSLNLLNINLTDYGEKVRENLYEIKNPRMSTLIIKAHCFKIDLGIRSIEFDSFERFFFENFRNFCPKLV